VTDQRRKIKQPGFLPRNMDKIMEEIIPGFLAEVGCADNEFQNVGR